MKILAALWLVLISGCGDLGISHFEEKSYPDKLSDWGLITHSNHRLILHPEAVVYELNTPLFSDYSQKLRTIYIPEGGVIAYRAEESFGFPVGSVISKTFFYPKDANGAVLVKSSWSGNPQDINTQRYKLIETRLLVKQEKGWDALPYIWSGEDAYLSETGALKILYLPSGDRINYLVPSKNQCASCHATHYTEARILPIGIKFRHLNRADPVYGINQIKYWRDRGMLKGERMYQATNLEPTAQDFSLDHQARSYLDINCGHCHNPNGSADTSALLLDYSDQYTPRQIGVCKPPIAAGQGSGGFLYSIVPGKADESILSYRLHSVEPAVMMPEIGRSLVHREGVALVDRWINSLSGKCL